MAKKTKGGKVTRGKKSAKKKAKKVNSQKARVDKIVASLNKELKGDGKIVTGDQVDELEFRRERTGVPAYDYILNGGLIKGSATNIWGPDRAAKTSMCAVIARNYQARGLPVALAAIEDFDKAWWRRLGVYIPYGAAEMKLLDSDNRKRARAYNAYYESLGTIPLTLMVHPNGLRALDFVVSASRTGVFALIIVDSLGAVVGQDEAEGKSIADAKYGGNSKELGIFANFLTSTFNYRFDGEGKHSAVGDQENATTTLCINQARVTIGSRSNAMHKKYHPPGGMGIRHLWNQQLFQYGAEEEGTKFSLDGRAVREVDMRTFRVVGTKMRGGPEQRNGEIDLSLRQWRDEATGRIWRAGDVDVWKSLRQTAALLGVVEKRGATLSFGGEKWKSKPVMESALRSDSDLYEALYDEMIEAARKDALTGSVPDVT